MGRVKWMLMFGAMSSVKLILGLAFDLVYLNIPPASFYILFLLME